jgi:hypothetical protein
MGADLNARGFEIRELHGQSAAVVPELLYKVFGYTYTDEWLYSTEQVSRSIEEGRAHFLAGFDRAGVARALIGLQRQFPSPELASLGPLAMDPAVEHVDSGQYLRLIMEAAHDRAWDLALTTGLKALVIQEVTEHQLTQRLGRILRFKTTGILLGVTPAWAERLRKPPVDRVARQGGALVRPPEDSHRLTEVVSVRPIPRTFGTPYEVSLPDRFADLMAEIYAGLKVPVQFSEPRPVTGATRLDCQFNFRRQRATIEIIEVGHDAPDLLADRLNHYRDGFAHIIQVVLPLEQGDINPAVERLVDEGCCFGAILPCYRSGDVLIMQNALRPTLEITDKDLFNPMARRIYRELV